MQQMLVDIIINIMAWLSVTKLHIVRIEKIPPLRYMYIKNH